MCSWISTFTGKRFNLINPELDQICIEDIAHALSQLCRWTGHTRRFYSIAEHSVHVSRLCKPEYRLAGLLHDAPEAYVNNLNRPLKKTNELRGYRLTELIIWNRIVEKFDLPQNIKSELPFDIKSADNILMNTEARDLLCDTSWVDTTMCLKSHIIPMTSEQAEAVFLLQFQSLTKTNTFDEYISQICINDTLHIKSENPIVAEAGLDQSGSGVRGTLTNRCSPPISPEELENKAEYRQISAALI